VLRTYQHPLLSSLVWGRVLTCHEDGGSKFDESLVVLYQTTTNSMEQCPSCETNRYSGIEEIPRNRWNFTVHYSNHNSPPPASIRIQNNPRRCEMSRNMVRFNGEELALHPFLRLEDHTLLAVSDCLFNTIFAATLHIGGHITAVPDYKLLLPRRQQYTHEPHWKLNVNIDHSETCLKVGTGFIWLRTDSDR